MEYTFSGEKVKPIRTIIEVVSSIVDGNNNFIFSDRGIALRTMEPSGAVFISFDIERDYFSSSEVDEETMLAINIEDLRKVLSRSIDAAETVTLAYKPDENKLVVTYQKVDKSQKRMYKLALHSPNEQDPSIYERAKTLPLSCTLNLQPGALKEILGDVGVAADKAQKSLTLNVDTEGVIFEVNQGMEGMSAKVELRKDNTDGAGPIMGLELEDDEAISALYDMDYLEKLTKLDGLAENVKLELGDNSPLRINFTISSIKFTYLMAPLEEEDGDDLEDE